MVIGAVELGVDSPLVSADLVLKLRLLMAPKSYRKHSVRCNTVANT